MPLLFQPKIRDFVLKEFVRILTNCNCVEVYLPFYNTALKATSTTTPWEFSLASNHYKMSQQKCSSTPRLVHCNNKMLANILVITLANRNVKLAKILWSFFPHFSQISPFFPDFHHHQYQEKGLRATLALR